MLNATTHRRRSGRLLAARGPRLAGATLDDGTTASHTHDARTRLVRFGARDDEPETSRWTATDPIGFSGGQTDLYAYADGEPVRRVDGTGTVVIASGVGGHLAIGRYAAVQRSLFLDTDGADGRPAGPGLFTQSSEAVGVVAGIGATVSVTVADSGTFAGASPIAGAWKRGPLGTEAATRSITVWAGHSLGGSTSPGMSDTACFPFVDIIERLSPLVDPRSRGYPLQIMGESCFQ